MVLPDYLSNKKWGKRTISAMDQWFKINILPSEKQSVEEIKVTKLQGDFDKTLLLSQLCIYFRDTNGPSGSQLYKQAS